MKKLVFLIFAVLYISCLMSQDVIIPRTKTTTEVEFSAIKTACEFDHVMSYYYDLAENADNGDDFVYDDGDAEGSRETFGAENLLMEAFKGAVDEIENEDELELATGYLENLQNEDTKFKPSRILEYMTNTGEYAFPYNNGAGRRGADLGYLLHYATFIGDCIWYYNQANQGRIREQLAPIAEFGWDILQNTNQNGLYRDGTGQNTINVIHDGQTTFSITYDDSDVNELVYYSTRRIQLACAVGYAGLVLDSLKYVNCAESQLFEVTPADYNFTNPSWTEPGWLGLYRSNSGFYTSGLAYFDSGMLFDNLYFTAMARSGIRQNPYDRAIVKDMVEQELNYISPEFAGLTINDAAGLRSLWNGYVISPKGLHGLIAYHNQTTNINSKIEETIEFYYNGYETLYPFNNPPDSLYPKLGSRKYFTIYAYKTGRNLDVTNVTVPSEIQAGTYSNEELTILRDNVNSVNDFRDNVTMIVTHENSYHSYNHNDGDQGSFQLWYKGKQLLIDPGYTSLRTSHLNGYSYHWLTSPYAHNCVLVNPNWTDERTELATEYWCWNADNLAGVYDPQTGTYNVPSNNSWLPYMTTEPIGRLLGGVSNDAIYNPATKQFCIKAADIKHLKVYIPYDHQYLEQTGCSYNGTDPNDDIDV